MQRINIGALERSGLIEVLERVLKWRRWSEWLMTGKQRSEIRGFKSYRGVRYLERRRINVEGRLCVGDVCRRKKEEEEIKREEKLHFITKGKGKKFFLKKNKNKTQFVQLGSIQEKGQE